MKRASLLSIIFLLCFSSCTTAPLTAEGDKIEMVESFSPTELLSYERVASLNSIGMASRTDCQNDLRNQASNAGATTLRVMPAEQAFCGLDGFSKKAEKKCFSMQGYAFRLKGGAPAPEK